MTNRRTGAQIVWESLLREGVEVVFGLPGGANLPIYDALAKHRYPIHHVLVTHEQGGAHMADGYARATGRVGVCMATSGPGATNLVTGIATAFTDSSPVVAITGQVSTSLLGRDGFQEADVQGISLPVTKHNYLVTDIRDLPDALKEAFFIARTGRPGPVLVDICKDAQQAEMEFEYPTQIGLPGYHPALSAADPASVARAAHLLNEAERPIIIAGQGVMIARAATELRQLAERANIPVVSTLLGIGAFAAYPSPGARHGRHARRSLHQLCHPGVRCSPGHRLAPRRPPDRRFQHLCPESAHRPHRPGPLGGRQDGEDRYRGDRRCPAHPACPDPAGRAERASCLAGPDRRMEERYRSPRRPGPRVRRPGPAVYHAAALVHDRRRELHGGQRRGPTPDVGGAVLPAHTSAQPDHFRRPGHYGLCPACGGRRAGGQRPTRKCGSWPATAGSR